MTASAPAQDTPITTSTTSGAPADPKPGGQTVSLYERWKRIHPLWVSGGWQTWRRVVLDPDSSMKKLRAKVNSCTFPILFVGKNRLIKAEMGPKEIICLGGGPCPIQFRVQAST